MSTKGRIVLRAKPAWRCGAPIALVVTSAYLLTRFNFGVFLTALVFCGGTLLANTDHLEIDAKSIIRQNPFFSRRVQLSDLTEIRIRRQDYGREFPLTVDLIDVNQNCLQLELWWWSDSSSILKAVAVAASARPELQVDPKTAERLKRYRDS
jgi:hypothetical protein